MYEIFTNSRILSMGTQFFMNYWGFRFSGGRIIGIRLYK